MQGISTVAVNTTKREKQIVQQFINNWTTIHLYAQTNFRG